MYCEPQELNSVLYEELQEAITRGDTELVVTHLNDAMAFVQSKLSQKYDMVEEFAKRGNQRNSLIVKYVKNIAVYFCYDLPETMPTKRMKAYDDAVKFLDDAKQGNIVIAGLSPAPVVPVTNQAGVTTWGGNKKRNNSLS
jgi:phage gp36-like protein